MPGTHPKQPVPKYTEEQLQNAMRAVIEGRLSRREAAAQYSIPRSTLGDKLSGKSQPCVTKQGYNPPKLEKTVEDRLAEWVLNMARMGFPRTPDQIKEAVKLYLDRSKIKISSFIENRSGKTWFSGFKRRYKDTIKVSKAECLEQARAMACTQENVYAWFNEFEKFLLENEIDSPDQIYNCDESGFPLQTATSMKVCVEKQVKRNFQIASSSKTSITTLQCIGANGTVIPPAILFPGTRFNPEYAVGFPKYFFLGFTKNGWMDTQQFYGWLTNHFVKQFQHREKGKKIVLLLDGHGSHIDYHSSLFCKENDILLFRLPPHTSHALQPADRGYFGNFKRNFSREVAKFTNEYPGVSITKRQFSNIFVQAYNSSCRKDIILSSFKVTGIWPTNRARVDHTLFYAAKAYRDASHYAVQEAAQAESAQPASNEPLVLPEPLLLPSPAASSTLPQPSLHQSDTQSSTSTHPAVPTHPIQPQPDLLPIPLPSPSNHSHTGTSPFTMHQTSIPPPPPPPPPPSLQPSEPASLILPPPPVPLSSEQPSITPLRTHKVPSTAAIIPSTSIVQESDASTIAMAAESEIDLTINQNIIAETSLPGGSKAVNNASPLKMSTPSKSLHPVHRSLISLEQSIGQKKHLYLARYIEGYDVTGDAIYQAWKVLHESWISVKQKINESSFDSQSSFNESADPILSSVLRYPITERKVVKKKKKDYPKHMTSEAALKLLKLEQDEKERVALAKEAKRQLKNQPKEKNTENTKKTKNTKNTKKKTKKQPVASRKSARPKKTKRFADFLEEDDDEDEIVEPEENEDDDDEENVDAEENDEENEEEEENTKKKAKKRSNEQPLASRKSTRPKKAKRFADFFGEDDDEEEEEEEEETVTSSKQEEEDNICKECGDTFVEGENWIQCDKRKCNTWYHKSCTNQRDIPNKEVKKSKWFCKFCSD